MQTDEEIKKEYTTEEFIRLYMNNHNGGTPRWLRGIFYDEREKIDTIIEYMSAIELKSYTLQEEYKKELIEKIGKIGVDLGEGRVLDIAWSDLKQNIITIINNSN